MSDVAYVVIGDAGEWLGIAIGFKPFWGDLTKYTVAGDLERGAYAYHNGKIWLSNDAAMLAPDNSVLKPLKTIIWRSEDEFEKWCVAKGD